MFASINQGIEAYRAELKAYKEWSDATTAKYRPGRNFMGWGGDDYRRMMEWNAEIRGMEKALGLSKEQVEHYCREAGMTVPS